MASDSTNSTPIKKGGKARRDWTVRFLKCLSEAGVVSHACQSAAIDRGTAYNRRKVDPTFAQSWDDAIEQAIGVVESEAYRRAVQGTLKPIYQGGVKVGEIREHSNTLLMFLLKAMRPEKYRESRNGGNVPIEVTPAPTLEVKAALAAAKAVSECG